MTSNIRISRIAEIVTRYFAVPLIVEKRREKRKCIRLFVAIVEFLTLILLKCFACKKFTMYDLNDIMRVSFYLLWIQQPLCTLEIYTEVTRLDIYNDYFLRVYAR